MSQPATVIALLGAESTGKTSLAKALGQALAKPLRQRGLRVAVVSEYLREFCDHQGRTPTQAEQAHIAAEQTRRIVEASQSHAVVVADTTALMTAVYSDMVFGDRTLYASALAAHNPVQLTLLTALDIAWQADGLQREGPQVRGPVDALIRAALQQANRPYSLVMGQGRARLAHALRSVHHALGWAVLETTVNGDEPTLAGSDAAAGDAPSPRWQSGCDRCSDPACERRCFLPRGVLAA